MDTRPSCRGSQMPESLSANPSTATTASASAVAPRGRHAARATGRATSAARARGRPAAARRRGRQHQQHRVGEHREVLASPCAGSRASRSRSRCPPSRRTCRRGCVARAAAAGRRDRPRTPPPPAPPARIPRSPAHSRPSSSQASSANPGATEIAPPKSLPQNGTPITTHGDHEERDRRAGRPCRWARATVAGPRAAPPRR